MIGIGQTIDEADTVSSNREMTMNKLNEDNEPLLSLSNSATAYVHHDVKIGRLKDGEMTMNKLDEDSEHMLSLSESPTAYVHHDVKIGLLKDSDLCDNLLEEDDADQKSITLESIKEKTILGMMESQRDRDFVSESSLTIVSDSALFLENSRWWSVINQSESNGDIVNPNLDNSINATIPHLYSSINEIHNNNNNTNTSNSTSNSNSSNIHNTPTTHSSHTVNINHNSISNYFHTRNPTRRRSSLLSDITFESDDHDEDAQTAESGDSSWANGSALLASGRRFCPGVNEEIIEEEHHDYVQQLKQGKPGRECRRAKSATTAAPAMPRRRVSSRASTNSSHNVKAAAIAATAVGGGADDFDASITKITHGNHAYAFRTMGRGSSAAPTIPKRTSSHNNKLPSIKNNAMLHPLYNASYAHSIADSKTSHSTEPSFFEDGSAAAAAAAAYLSSKAKSEKEDGDGRGMSREEVPETPPTLPERRQSVNDHPSSFGTFSSFEEEDETPSVVHEEELNDSDSAVTGSKTSHHLPKIPLRKRSGSGKNYSGSTRSAGIRKPAQRSPSRLNNTQPPTCPMRKDSSHFLRNGPIAPVINKAPRNAEFSLLLSPHQPQVQPSHKHKPPTKPMRTNSNRTPTLATSSS